MAASFQRLATKPPKDFLAETLSGKMTPGELKDNLKKLMVQKMKLGIKIGTISFGKTKKPKEYGRWI